MYLQIINIFEAAVIGRPTFDERIADLLLTLLKHFLYMDKSNVETEHFLTTWITDKGKQGFNEVYTRFGITFEPKLAFDYWDVFL